VNTEKRPPCPRCDQPELERQVSRFAVSKGRSEADTDDNMPDIDESRMERAMQALASEAQGLDENDPRQAARMMRKLSEAMGTNLGSGMEEAIRRMEAGESMDQIEAEMGDLLDTEDPMGLFEAKRGGKPAQQPSPRPQVDHTLYEL